MRFLFPLGLLGLIGIPILIIVYIIKSKYAEITVSSTYIWRLSEKFLKRRNPLNKLTGIIGLILQLLMVAVISFAIAHPMITLPGSANEYCFVLDGSASMRMEDENGNVRFDLAKQEIEKVIDGAGEGSVYSLIYVGEGTRTVYERMESKEGAKLLLSELQPTYGTVEYSDAIGKAQMMFERNRSTITYLVTDKKYEKMTNAELISVGDESENYAVSGVSYTLLANTLTVSGSLNTYTSAAELEVELYIDGLETPVASQIVNVDPASPAAFSLSCTSKSFSSLKVKIVNEDAFALDNEVIIFNAESEKSYKTLIVSDTPFFMESIISTVTNAEVTVMSTEEYNGQTGYGLYIFESYELEELPRDGAVWFINPKNSVPKADFSFQGEVALEAADTLDLTSSSSALTRSLINGVSGEDIYITYYAKCSPGRGYTTLLSYKGSPVLFAGLNGYGNRQVVFGFDIRNSNLPLLMDFVSFTKNFVAYSFPAVLEDVNYDVGEEMSVNVIANCESIRLDSPSGKIDYLNVDTAISSYMLEEAGVYDITMMVSGSPREFSVYSSIPEAERKPMVVEAEFALQGEKENNGFDGEYDPMMILFISMVVLFIADWGVYCYEKYQLR